MTNKAISAEEIIIDDVKVQSKKFILFTLSGEIYGIEALRVKEIVEYDNITVVPMVGNAICGVTNLRGMIIPVIDLSVRFGKNSRNVTRRTCIVIIEEKHGHEERQLGIKIDAINSVINLTEDEIQDVPSFGTDVPVEFISSLGTYQGKFITLLDLDTILSVESLAGALSNNAYFKKYSMKKMENNL